MATTSKKEKVLIAEGNNVIELTGLELEAFETERKKMQEVDELNKQHQEAQKELKISAYKKLGLTDEEIAAII